MFDVTAVSAKVAGVDVPEWIGNAERVVVKMMIGVRKCMLMVEEDLGCWDCGIK
jgi:hypothetical protein